MDVELEGCKKKLSLGKFGRNWMAQLVENFAVAQQSFGSLQVCVSKGAWNSKGTTVKIQKVQPKFCKPHPVPYTSSFMEESGGVVKARNRRNN